MEESSGHGRFTEKLKKFFVKTGETAKRLAAAFARALYPEGIVCIACKTELKTEDERYLSLCLACAEQLPFRTGGRVCARCGDYMPPEAEGGCCDRCKTAEPFFDGVFAAFDYRGIAKAIITDYKKAGDTYLSFYIARYLADYLRALPQTADCLVYVPSTPKTVRKRGFDHIELAGKALSKETGLPLLPALIKHKDIPPQKTANREERIENMKGAFEKNPVLTVGALQGKTVFLLDDVVTTGATANACAKVLKETGAEKVFVLAFART